MLKTRSLISIPIAFALSLTLAGPTAVAKDDFGAPPKIANDHQTNREIAADTLAEVEAIVDGDAVSRGGRTTDGRDLTVALRDLKRDLKYLAAADRKTAQRFFLRPGDPGDPYIPGNLAPLPVRCRESSASTTPRRAATRPTAPMETNVTVAGVRRPRC